jgi:hypothetical protein
VNQPQLSKQQLHYFAKTYGLTMKQLKRKIRAATYQQRARAQSQQHSS